MRILINRLLPVLLILISNYVYAQKEPLVEIGYNRGFRQENFNWSIAGNNNGQNPNVYSELKWRNLKGTVNNIDLSVRVWKHVGIMAGYGKTSLNKGDVNDTDYGSDNRTGPVYNQNFGEHSGYTDNWFVGAGYDYRITPKLNIFPAIGYGGNRQSLDIFDETGRFPNLNSSYANSWQGPFLDFKAGYQLVSKLNLMIDLRYNQVDYHAQANWNLISQFSHPVSFTDYAKGYGVNTSATLSYKVIDHVRLRLSACYYYWETGKGNDNLYLANGQTDVTQFNGAYRKGYLFTGGISLYY